MSRTVCWMSLVAASVWMGQGSSVWAEDKPGAKPETATIESKVSEGAHDCCIGACNINYPKELGLSLTYL